MEEEKTASKKILLLFVQEGLVNGIVYSFTEKELKVSGMGSPTVWQGNDYQTLKEAIESSLGKHLKDEEEKIKQVIFVVSPFWMAEGERLKEKKSELLKSLCQEYQWSTGGFIVDDESLVFHFRKEDEIPPSFLSLFVFEKGYRISLIHLGKIKKRLKLNFDNLSADKIKEGLERLDFEGILPPKFIVWGNIPPDFEEEMVNYPWVNQKGDLFLHLPEVQILDWPQLALIFKEMVSTQTGAMSLSIKEEKKDKKPVRGEISGESKDELVLPAGFSFDDLGKSQTAVFQEEKKEEKVVQEEIIPKEKFLAKKIIFLKRFFLKGKLAGKILATGIAVLVFLWLFVVKKEIVLYVTSQEGIFQDNIILSPKSMTDGFLPVREEAVEEEVSGEEIATGVKMIGEKAKGKVVIFNRTDNVATLPSGTIIVGPSDLEFLFLDEIKIASKTPDLTIGVDRWGEGEVEVEAAEIGSRYNLAPETVFKIKGKAEGSFLVKNREALEGGTSREVTAISLQDLERLKENLIESAKKKVEDKLVAQKSNEEELLEETVRIETVSFVADKKAGEEGEKIKATLKMRASGLVINRGSLANFAENKLTSQVPKGYQLEKNSVQMEFLPKEKKDDQWFGKVTLKGSFYPEIDIQRLAEKLRVKSKGQIVELIKKQPRVYRYEIKTIPPQLSFFPLSPYRRQNITITVIH